MLSIIADNPFRILDVYANASTKENRVGGKH